MPLPHRLINVVFFLLLSSMGLSLRAETTAARFPLTPAAVARALLATGVAIDAADISLPSPLSAAGPSPDLEVRSAEPAGPGQLRVRLSCHVAGQCLPFLAILNLHDAVTALAAQAKLPSSSAQTRPVKLSGVTTLRAGQHTTLLFEDTHMRIMLPVISVDTGGVGADVRVASLDRKQLYRGTVSEEGIVRGVLP